MLPQVAVIIYAIFSLSKNPRLQGSLSPLSFRKKDAFTSLGFDIGV